MAKTKRSRKNKGSFRRRRPPDRAAVDEGTRVAVLMRALWGARAFRESFIDSHKAGALGGQRRRARHAAASPEMMRVYRVFAAVFTSIESSDAVATRKNGGSGALASFAAASLSATSCFSFLRFLVSSGFVTWAQGATKKQFGDQVRLHISFGPPNAPSDKLFLQTAAPTNNADDQDSDAMMTLKRLERMLKRHAKWLERADRTDSSKSSAASLSPWSRGLLAHLSAFNLVISSTGVLEAHCEQTGDADGAHIRSIRIPLSDLLSCKWKRWTGTPSETPSLDRYFQRRGGSRVCIHTRLTYGRGATSTIDLVLPDAHGSLSSSRADTDGLNSFAGHDFCDFVDQTSSLPCPVTICRGFQELLHPGTASAGSWRDDGTNLSHSSSMLHIAPLKNILPRSYASMDSRYVTSGLFFDILHVLCRPRDNNAHDGHDGGGGSKFKSGKDHHLEAASLLKSTDAGAQFVDERKTSTSHSPANVFRHDIVVEWPRQTRVDLGQVASTTTKVCSNGLLPARCFRFWHPASVETFVSMHEQCVLGVAPDVILKRVVNEGVSLGLQIRDEEDERENRNGKKEDSTIQEMEENSREKTATGTKLGDAPAHDSDEPEQQSSDGSEKKELSLHPDHCERFEDSDSDSDNHSAPFTMPPEGTLSKEHAERFSSDSARVGIDTGDNRAPPENVADQTFNCFQGRVSNAQRAEDGLTSGSDETSSDILTNPSHAKRFSGASDNNSEFDSEIVIVDAEAAEAVPLTFATMLRKLLETRAFKSLGYQRANTVLNQSKTRGDHCFYPTLRLETRPAVFCVRLEWPSHKALRSPRLGSKAVDLVWSTLRTTNGRLDLYAVFDTISGKARDGRDPENIRACRYRLFQIICFVGYDASGVYRFARAEPTARSPAGDNAAEDDVWTLYDGHDQVRAGLSWEDVRTVCRDHHAFPELLFFESQGPTDRDTRLRERHKRTDPSNLVPASGRWTREPDVDSRAVVRSESSVLHDSPSEPVIRGYGTIDQECASSLPSFSAPNSPDELEPNWCSGPCEIQ